MSNVKKNYKEIEKKNNNNMNADVAQLEGSIVFKHI